MTRRQQQDNKQGAEVRIVEITNSLKIIIEAACTEESFNRNNSHSNSVKAASELIRTGSANCIGGSVKLEVPGGGARRGSNWYWKPQLQLSRGDRDLGLSALKFFFEVGQLNDSKSLGRLAGRVHVTIKDKEAEKII